MSPCFDYTSNIFAYHISSHSVLISQLGFINTISILSGEIAPTRSTSFSIVAIMWLSESEIRPSFYLRVWELSRSETWLMFHIIVGRSTRDFIELMCCEEVCVAFHIKPLTSLRNLSWIVNFMSGALLWHMLFALKNRILRCLFLNLTDRSRFSTYLAQLIST